MKSDPAWCQLRKGLGLRTGATYGGGTSSGGEVTTSVTGGCVCGATTTRVPGGGGRTTGGGGTPKIGLPGGGGVLPGGVTGGGATGGGVTGGVTGGGGVIPGYSNQRQLELLVEAGFTPLEAISIGTLNGAKYLGRDARVGTIAIGKQADLVVIDGDPSKNIADVRKVETVFKQGIGFDPAKLVASETAVRVTDRALQVHGGHGYARELPIERYYRDARGLTLHFMTAEMLRIKDACRDRRATSSTAK